MRHLQFLGRHTASEPEVSVETGEQSEAPIAGLLPLPVSPHHPVISRLGAVSVEARLSLLQSRDLPLNC